MEKKVPVTLEGRLRECAVQNERAESLLRSYEAIKEDMKMYLPAIFSYYPHYSAHDSSHSQSLISAIELILGETRILELYPADLWLILAAAQLHDIGMILPNEEIIELINKPDFKKYLEHMKETSDIDFARAAALLLDKEIPECDHTWFLDIKQSVILLIAEYMRRRHAERSGSIVSGDTVISRLLSMKHNGEMTRAFTTVGNICAMHGRNFDDIFTLYETDSILHMECHPRFVAAFIRLGDLCDVDNGRFNAAMMTVFGKLPQSSLVHFYKHKTITRLCISTREICMSADIPFEKIQDELVREGYGRTVKGEDFCHRIVHEHQHWFSMVQEELQNILLHAGEIYPEDMDQTLPAFRQEILVNGQRSVLADSNLRLNFAPEKAYALIEGYSLYDEQRTFVREFVQNSLDAMKIQLWRDLKDGRWNPYLPKEKRDRLSALQPFDLCKEIYEAYRVEIITETSRAASNKTITFRDSGIGISYDDLQNNIIRTGTSWGSREKYESELSEMPPWMRPTGGFGIGLHAAFAVTDKIEIKSRTRNEEYPKHIIIHSGQQDGFVFARTVEEPFFFGTEIMVEIEKDMSEIRSAKSEISPYDDQPEDEFAFFIEEYLKKMICCPLFPVYLNKKEMGEMLSTGSLYGAIFDKERREENDEGIALAVTDDVPMRYIVWNQKPGHFYRLLPGNCYSRKQCSFKGIILEHCMDVSDFYDNMMHLESLECLSADSKSAISADRKDFLTDYKGTIAGMTKSIFKPLLCFGEEQFIKQLKVSSGSLSTEDFLKLCDAIAKCSVDKNASLSTEGKERLDEFVRAMAEEMAEKKAVYFIYLVFAHLRYFKESIDWFLLENPDLPFSEDNDNERLEKLMIFLQPQFQFVTNNFAYLYEQSNSNIVRALDPDIVWLFGHYFCGEFISSFDSNIDRTFGYAFSNTFGNAFGNAFVLDFGGAFDTMFRYGNFCGDFGRAFVENSGRAFIKNFGRAFNTDLVRAFASKFGNHILTNEWAWLPWIGYYEKCIPRCVTSVYFQSVPAFYFQYYIEEAKTCFDIFNKSELSVLYKNLHNMCNSFPFHEYLCVKEMKLKNNMLLCTLEAEDSTKSTINVSEKDVLAVYYRQLEEYHCTILCPTSYMNLGVEAKNILDENIIEIFFPRNLYIVLPRIVEETRFLSFINANKQKNFSEIVETVMQAEDTVNVIKYIYLHRQNQNVTQDEIRTEYHEFLTDFVTARLEDCQNASLETTIKN